jgi:hypothetical protein
MNSFFQDYYQKLKFEIKEIGQDFPGLLQRLERTVDAIRNTINILRNHLKSNPFQDEIEEIEYFRKVQPMFLSEYIYYITMMRHEIEKISKCTPNAYKAACKAKLKSIAQYYEDNKLVILYYKSEHNNLDKEFFLRNTQPLPFILDESLMWLDKEFTTGYDMIIARSLAYDQFSQFLKKELNILKTDNSFPNLSQLGKLLTK